MVVLGGRRDLVAVYDDAAAVLALAPDMRALAALGRPVIVTAADAGGGADFVSRFFAPGLGVDEDPVTGSAHATLIPYWASRLGKLRLDARQVSRRGGELRCDSRGDRVTVAGRCAAYLEGTITVDA